MPKIIMQDLGHISKIYFVGIKGVGMTSLAIIAKEAGFTVSGSDIAEEFLTDEILQKNKIHIDEQFSESVLKEFMLDTPTQEVLIITTAAHDGLENPQCLYAKKIGVQVITHGQAVGVFMDGEIFRKSFQGISVLGCHGKTTVAAMCAAALTQEGFDPTYAVGTSEIFPLGNPGHLGKGKFFIAEADEFISDIKHDRTVKFLYQYPQIAIMNNIDFDHPDVYLDLEAVYQAFFLFARENIKENGTLIINGDDKNLLRLQSELARHRTDLKIITFGEKEDNMVRLSGSKEFGWGIEFELIIQSEKIGIQRINVPGYHNAKNALAVASLLYGIGFKMKGERSLLSNFKGSKRRQEKVGETKSGAIVIDDYAHHPDEIEKTVAAICGAFPDKKIITIFQPHTVGRTQSLANAFANAFQKADNVLFLPVFSSKREGDLDYSDIYLTIEEGMKKNGTNVTFFKDERSSSETMYSPYFLKKYRSNVVKYILDNYDSSDFVVLTLGAGDVYKIAYDLVALSK